MSIEYEEAIKIIDKNKELFYYDKNISQENVNEAERMLDITFPASYRDFLKRYGYLRISSYEIYGLVVDVNYEAIPNAVWLNIDERNKFNFPKDLFIIGSTGYGEWYAIDLLNTSQKGEAVIVVTVPNEKNGEYAKKKIFNNFGEYLLKSILFPLLEEHMIVN